MDLSVTTAQLILLFIPGVIWTMMDAAHRPANESGQFDFIVRSFFFGVISYAVLALAYRCCGKQFNIIDFADKGWRFQSAVDELIWASIIAFVLSLGWLASRTHKWLNRFLRHLRITNQHADKDIWQYAFNENSPLHKYVQIRDFDSDLIYTGFVRSFSDRDDIRELFLQSARVFTGQSVEIYSTPYLYIAREPHRITMDFPVDDDER